ncbi:hypothetical protein CYMTET_13874 [Cymbomonas tetramitiformis]|uniref:Uncharacterized protein n=1 Tax=Cymbomonas tetramitiformis TaxID=36881 RepID=A0AAE0LAX9_9CHLO|nr:hypothetical protein CYMTET_13874 [Cymbomonas tetramitiformis]
MRLLDLSKAIPVTRKFIFHEACPAFVPLNGLRATSECTEQTPSPKSKADSFSCWEAATRLKELKGEGLIDMPEFKKYKLKLLDRLTSKPAGNPDSESSKRRGLHSRYENDRADSSDESLEEISPSKTLSNKRKSRASQKSSRPKDEDFVVWEDLSQHDTCESAQRDGIEAALANQ